MEDSEKLPALKKAYADIILNTAKEAAARIMVSEKKAMRFQRELVSTKDEALRMLVRLKQMLDTKTSEAETISLKQRKKIEELEAQLGEAEEIVRDLREELRVVQAELERVTNPLICSQDEKLLGNETLAQEEILENQLSTHEPTNSVLESQFVVTNHCIKYPTTNGELEGSKWFVAHDHINNSFIGNPDFPSIAIRRKENELYRKGCTQRIRAFERSLLESDLSLSQQADDIENESFIREEENKQISVTPCPEGDVVQEIEKNPDEQMLVNTDNICTSLSAEKAIRRKQKRAARFKRNKPLSSKLPHDEVNEMQNAPQFLCARGSPDVTDDDDDKTGVNSSISSQNEATNDLVSSPKAPSHTSEMTKQSGSVTNDLVSSPKAPSDTSDMTKQPGSVECAEGYFGTYHAWRESNGDKELMNEPGLIKQESSPADNLNVSACSPTYKTSEDGNQKESDLEDKITSHSENNMLLKYTFRRKRKKECLSSPEGECSLEKRNMMKQVEGKQNGRAESQKSCSNAESSRSNRRVAQVARQLISLSEKKWWQ